LFARNHELALLKNLLGMMIHVLAHALKEFVNIQTKSLMSIIAHGNAEKNQASKQTHGVSGDHRMMNQECGVCLFMKGQAHMKAHIKAQAHMQNHIKAQAHMQNHIKAQAHMQNHIQAQAHMQNHIQELLKAQKQELANEQ
jgi:hypothetical protein